MKGRKFFRAIYGLWLTALYLRVFPFEMLTGKRVALVGPASSAFNTGSGSFIDSFDVVIRVNKSPYVVASSKFEIDIGKRTDILFHSFYENGISGGGILDLSLYDNQGIQYVINPRNTLSGLRNTFNFYKKYLLKRKTFTLPKTLYAQICAPLNGLRPTVGFTSLTAVLLAADFNEFFITGFTFYKTPFGSGYRDEIQDPQRAKAFIQEQGIHNIDLEFEAFKAIMKKTTKNVLMDEALTNIVNAG